MDNTKSVKINELNVKSFLESIDTFIFDCDGVLWVASDIVKGAIETLNYLRSIGKGIKFVTNNSTKTRQQILDKIKSFGIECYLEEVYGSSYGAVIYLQHIEFQTRKNNKVFMIGENGLENELKSQGFQVIKEIHQAQDGSLEHIQLEIDNTVGAVVIGMDTKLSFQKAVYAHKCILENEGCIFIATNTDTSYPVQNGKSVPGAGSIVAMIETSTSRKPFIIGKPHTLLLDLILKKHNLVKERTCMIGDRLDTDILFGVNGGIKSLLVLSGIATIDDLNSPNATITPNYYADSIADLLLN